MNEQMIKNDPIADMHREVKNNASLFDGFVLMDEPEGTVVYHEACDEDIVKIEGGDKEFADVLDEVLKHAAECEPLADEEDDEDEDLDYDDEEIEP